VEVFAGAQFFEKSDEKRAVNSTWLESQEVLLSRDECFSTWSKSQEVLLSRYKCFSISDCVSKDSLALYGWTCCYSMFGLFLHCSGEYSIRCST
jgi:hypothetical protein